MKTNKKFLFILIAFITFFIALKTQMPAWITEVNNVQLTQKGQISLAVLIFALILWTTEALPFHITGLLTMFMMAVFKVADFKDIVKAGFGNDIIIFFICILIISSFITRSGFGNRISLFIISRTGNNTSMIILGFLIVGVVLSMGLSQVAVAAILTPLARNILVDEGLKPMESKFGKALMIAAAWGPVIGGISTPVGSGTNPLAIGFMKDMAGVDVSFLEWMLFGVPASLLLILPAWGTIRIFFNPEIKTLSKSREDLRQEYLSLPKIDREEKITITIFLLTILIWITTPFLENLLGISIPISLPILFSSALFFFPGMSSIGWKEIEKEIDWSSVILIVSGVSLGIMLHTTGAANWLSVILLGGVGGLSPFFQAFAVVFIVSLLKIIFTSNTVTGTIIIPIMIALAQSTGLNPLAISFPAALTSSLAFILVTSSPTNIIPYSTGYFSISDMAKAGIVLTIFASLIIALIMTVLGSVGVLVYSFN